MAALLITLLSCGNAATDKTNSRVPLIQKDTTNEIEKKNTLFVFVGEKIDFSILPNDPDAFDTGIKARYKILQAVYGHYDADEIEFEAYDHYGVPRFTKYKTVLLYLSKHEGKYYQEKYMFDQVVRTKDGRWAGPYSREYGHMYNKHTPVKPEKIDFAEEISLPAKDLDGYLVPYYKRVGDTAIAVYGNYLPELFKLRRDGVLTARDLFPGKKEAAELPISEETLTK